MLDATFRSVCFLHIGLFCSIAGIGACGAGEPASIQPLLEAVRSVDREGKGHRAAIEAWPRLAELSAEQLPQLLAGMDGANPLACNWIRSAAETVIQRHTDRGGTLPSQQLESFLLETRHAPRARRFAYELIVRQDPAATKRLIPGLLNDPSLELRRDAVAMTMEEAASLVGCDRTAAIEAYRRAWDAARDVDQAREAAKKLLELGVQTSLIQHFGFLTDWKLIGPFDNRDDVGFEKAYPPEQELNLSAQYPGKLGTVGWTEHRSTDALGVVDLNDAFGRPKAAKGTDYADTPELLPRFKGAIAYALAEFTAPVARDVEVRLGCINGHKVWLNGELVIVNHVFHAGMVVDQYAGNGKLRPGRNTVLVKIAQNEQTDDWAQNWQFQLRICDELGTAVLPDTTAP